VQALCLKHTQLKEDFIPAMACHPAGAHHLSTSPRTQTGRRKQRRRFVSRTYVMCNTARNFTTARHVPCCHQPLQVHI
jgi:hypothetical protein